MTVFGSAEELDALEAAGYSVGRTIEGPATWRDRAADWRAEVKAEQTAEAAARAAGAAEVAPRGDIIVLRVDYFENYAGRFLSVEAKDGTRGISTTGASLALSWNTGAGTAIDQGPRTMNVNIDPDTTPDTYIEHRILVKVGEAGSSTPAAPTKIRIGSSLGAFVEADVKTWLGGGLPPMSSDFLSNFTTRYLDPTEVYGRFRELVAEFPDLTTIIPLPNKTNGYQRRAQALMAGLTNPAFTGNLSGTVGPQAVILTSRAWGHEGGNDLTAEFVDPARTELAAHGELRGQRPRRRPGDERDGCAHEHRRPGGGGDQRSPGRGRQARRADVPRERGRGRRPGSAEEQPVRLPHDGHECARPPRAVRVLRAADREEPAGRQRSVRAPAGAWASSSTVSSTPASGRRR